MKNKKAVEVQFNWIFVLIAGGVILAFFVAIIIRQKGISEQAVSTALITSLEAILTGAKATPGLTYPIEMPPEVEIKFDCDKYSIGNIPRLTKTSTIFAPGLVKGRKLIAWVLDWSMPYRVTNFLYLTSIEMKYIIVGSNDLAKEINQTLPGDITKEIVDSITEAEKIKDQNNYKVRFIFVDTTSSVVTLDKSFKDVDVTAIQIIPASGDSLGTINFYEKIKDSLKDSQELKITDTTSYLTKEALIGAIFSEDAEMYNCVMEKAFEKLEIITKIYIARSKELAASYGAADTCAFYHSTLELDNIVAASSKLKKQFPPSDPSELNPVLASANALKSQNRNAMIYSCALIY